MTTQSGRQGNVLNAQRLKHFIPRSPPPFSLKFEGAAIVSFQMNTTNGNYSKCQQYHLYVNFLFYLFQVRF